MHRAKLHDAKSLVLKACTNLPVEEGTGRLKLLEDPDDDRHGGNHKERDRHCHYEVQQPLQRAIQWILKGFSSRRYEIKCTVLKVNNPVAKFVLQVANDQQPG